MDKRFAAVRVWEDAEEWMGSSAAERADLVLNQMPHAGWSVAEGNRRVGHMYSWKDCVALQEHGGTCSYCMRPEAGCARMEGVVCSARKGSGLV
jgi:hypothetical protein